MITTIRHRRRGELTASVMTTAVVLALVAVTLLA